MGHLDAGRRTGHTVPRAWSTSPALRLELHVDDGVRLADAVERIVAGRRAEFVADVAGEPEVGDVLRDEAIVDLLRRVDVGPARNAGRVEVPDPLDVFPNRRSRDRRP